LGFEKLNRNSISIRLFIIAALVLVMMIPSIMINSLVSERETRKNEATDEIASKWAYAQTIGGPMFTLPYEETVANTEGKPQSVTGYIQLLPESLEIKASMKPEIRYRGIYKAILYNAKINLSGYFSFAKLSALGINPQRIKGSDAFIAVSISDMRGIKDVIPLNWNQEKLFLEPGINKDDIINSKFGVKLFSPVTEYTKTTRAVKYLFMFVGLTFLVFFLVEVFNKKRIHPIQYLLIGLSLCIFYVLLLSLSEHLQFEWAYLIASLSVTALITFYVKNALGTNILTSVTAVLLIVLYGFMYVLLQNQDYALLLGSIGIFIIMAAVMYLSRNVDWYKIELNS
jgi:Inner membrane protein involved in colicin E2 resistance